jgi:hypothetical protein
LIQVNTWKNHSLSDGEAKEIVYDAFVEKPSTALSI